MTTNWFGDDLPRSEWSPGFWSESSHTHKPKAKPPPDPTFHRFKDLPRELREEIWDLSLPDPQVITITLVHDEETIIGSPTEKEGIYGNITRLVEKCQGIYEFPSLLLTSQEARSRALRRYKLSFEDNFIYPIYFDPVRDTLHLANCNTLTAFKYFTWSRKSLEVMTETRFLGIGGKIALWFSFMGMRQDSANCLLLFENLESLSLERGEEGDIMFAGREYEERIVGWLGGCWRRQRMGFTAGSKDVEDIEGENGNDEEDENQDDVTSDGKNVEKSPPPPRVKIPKITFMSKEAMQDLGMCLLWEN